MDLQTVIKNLENTIAGKKIALDEYKDQYDAACNLSLVRNPPESVVSRMALRSTIAFLEINVAELERIAADVKQCVPVVIAYDHLG